ncbi:30S ribosomal protein S19 [Candidatus Pacearchaeota archaeon]|nr:30S ribosomal protein S19 [Candidatus Pacearchaeota archaeon]|tara:strand:- start:148 stop:552 length:405 start_codon:yes stop_codon:yes gene_type:complete
MAEVEVKSKEKFYRGKNIEDLKKLDVREFAKLVKARPRRAILRNFDVVEQFIKKCNERIAKKKLIKTHTRNLVIVPAFVGLTINVHKGNSFVPVKITEEMLGHRLGEFALTRKSVKHGAAGVGATKSSASLSVK